MNKEGLIKNKNELLIKEFQTILSIFYIFLIIIGMIFSNYQYEVYGINIFDYATIFDFLILPFKDILIIVFSVLSILMVSLVFLIPKMIKKYQKKEKEKNIKPKSKFELMIQNSKYSMIIMSLALISLFYNYSSSIAEKYAKRKKQNIISQNDTTVELLTNDAVKGKIIGKTEGFLFLYQKDEVRIIPITTIKSILKNLNNE